MQTFYCKLVPPRSTFTQDITPAEGKAMQEHAAYWKDWMTKGKIILFGLVGDPAVVHIPGAHYDIHLMLRGAVHP
jgi:hypothetical protein